MNPYQALMNPMYALIPTDEFLRELIFHGHSVDSASRYITSGLWINIDDMTYGFKRGTEEILVRKFRKETNRNELMARRILG